jgi:hypothetical protein
MEESTTYQGIVRRGREERREVGRAEGRAEEARRMLLLLGETKFGPADAATRSALENISDLARLEELGQRLMNVSSWQELLPPPSRRRRKGRNDSGS